MRLWVKISPKCDDVIYEWCLINIIYFVSAASRDDLNGNSSPNKSRIPVLRSPSYKVPKNVCFGKGQQKAFDMKHWYQTIARSTRTASSEESNFSQKMAENFERDMKMALD